MSEIAGQISRWSEKVKSVDMSRIIISELLTAKPYLNPTMLYLDSGLANDYPPYFWPEFSFDLLENGVIPTATTPDITPPFVDFTYFVGSIQNLNSQKFWRYLLQERSLDLDTDIDFMARRISEANTTLYDGTLVNLAGIAIFGDRLPEVTHEINKHCPSYIAMLPLLEDVGDIAESIEQVRERILSMLGTPENGGTLTKVLKESPILKRCPGIELSISILKQAGRVFADNDFWNVYSRLYFYDEE